MEKPHNGVLEAWYRETVGPNGQYWIKGMSHGHPHYNGQHIHTSRVIAEDGNEVETLNSRYTLGVSLDDTIKANLLAKSKDLQIAMPGYFIRQALLKKLVGVLERAQVYAGKASCHCEEREDGLYAVFSARIERK